MVFDLEIPNLEIQLKISIAIPSEIPIEIVQI